MTAPAMSDGQGPFEILLVQSERTITVGRGESALQALIAAGLPIEPGCQTGACGTCITEYVEGDVVHKDACLSAHDREHHFCPCVSRARSRIVINQ